MKNLTALSILLAAALLTSCETSVDVPEPPHTPRVALSFTLTPTPQDSSFEELYQQRQLYISSSQSVFDQKALTGRADATVELRDAAGNIVERYEPVRAFLGFSSTGAYRPVLGYQPQPGQTYTLRAAVPGLETVESTQTIPTPPVVESGTYTPRAGGSGTSSSQQRGRVNLVLQDDPATANYYVAYARVLDAQGKPGQWSSLDVDYGDEDTGLNIEQFQLSSLRTRSDVYPFADTNVNGKRISLASDVSFFTTSPCPPGQPSCPTPTYIEVYVSSITPEAYNFYLSRRRYEDSDDSPFAEPAPLTSNVRSGYGLFAGAADATYRIPL
ncbi:DUF4249 domain-containing protein [Hymenobacter terrenus]|uniref:DUF4249 domain-containing protein n=1 Tax=Hymenobacter terrenus TaxID=1629124 RepID=UPI0006193CBB|nr:DUF4249 domain-containing protein [Hymenobacter terrenus]